MLFVMWFEFKPEHTDEVNKLERIQQHSERSQGDRKISSNRQTYLGGNF